MMDEKKEEKEEEQKEEQKPAEDTGAGDKPSSTSLIDNAGAAAERLETAIKKQEELLKRQEELEARKMLGGRSEGKDESHKKEMTPAEYKETVMKGEIPNE